ncbi:MAG TPA: glycosyltransferase family 39 protein [Candidatus Limnocylindrales bacterium]
MKVQMLKGTEARIPPRLITVARFLLVGLSGIAVNEVVYIGLVEKLAVWFVLAAILSTQVSTTWNFLGNEVWTFSGRRFAGPVVVRYLAYSGVNNSLLLLRVPMLFLMADFGHLTPGWSNLIALGVLFVVRFAVSDGLVWRKKAAGEYDALDASGKPAQTYRYDIGGLLRLDSDTALPELLYFRTAAVTPPDIRIKTRRVGALPTPRVRLRRNGERITYREHLGIFGADFNVTLGDTIEVEASQLLSLSRHVLYTNVIEALLRFVLVSKGYVLLHSAGLEVDGKATLLSAQTDTGKTSTVINMVRERQWKFISDDMAIIDPKGIVRTFPKPMTLSFHTMTRAVDVKTLSPRKRVQLQIQSRVHSKSGRTVGKGLGTLNVPIMSINSVLQIIVPPPKYHITSLLPAEIAAESPIANVFLMERGEPVQERVELDAAVDQLIENTDDAYGFPPFSTLAPHFLINGQNYEQLRARERELLKQAIQNVTIWRLRVRGHEWGELLPRLIQGDASESVGIPIETQDREPVGIPIETQDREPVGIPIGTAVRELIGIPVEVRPPVAMAGDMSYSSGPLVPQPAQNYLEQTAESGAAGLPFVGGGPSGRRKRSSGTSSFSADLPIAESRVRKPRRSAIKVGPSALAAATLATSEAMVVEPYGGFQLPRGLPIGVNLADVRTRVETRVRENARTWAALTAVLVAAAILRLWAIGSVGFNNDEAVYAGQGASLAADQTYSGLFAIFRAHPLLVQFLYSISFRFLGVNDVAPRVITVAFGLGGVALVYATGSMLYGRRVGLIAATILALMPYHVIVTRQALLDGPETTLFLLSMYLMSRFARGGDSRWFYGAAFATGLTVLAKETAVLIVPVAIAFMLLAPEIRIGLRRLLLGFGLFVMAFAPYPMAIMIGKGTGAAQSFLLWQVLRQPNHTWTFYGDILPGAVGPIVFLIALAGLAYAVRQGRWEDRLLICWIAVPVAFFELWPVKGYQYLLPIAPAIAILVGLAFDRALSRSAQAVSAAEPRADQPAVEAKMSRERSYQMFTPGLPAFISNWRPPLLFIKYAGVVLLAVTFASIGVASVEAVSTTSMSGSLAGTGGMPGGRDAGLWIRENVPMGGAFLTTGPTMANIVEYYGQRHAYGLSVSPNPLRRNPAYDPIVNPDRALQLNQIQYIATDVWSAQRSPYFDGKVRSYVSRYHGTLVYQQSADVRDSAGHVSSQVVIQIYEVRP